MGAKNHRRLIDAVSLLDDAETALLLTGPTFGSLATLEEHARLRGVDDRVRHLGFVSRTQLAALYRRARALVFPSLYEGFGAPPLEAMACGCPVATSGASSLGEACGGAALYFDAREPESIAGSCGSTLARRHDLLAATVGRHRMGESLHLARGRQAPHRRLSSRHQLASGVGLSPALARWVEVPTA